MLTLFTIPKPFRGAAAAAQERALANWRALGDEVEVLVIGDEEGAAEAAARAGAVHVPDVERTEWGTPLVGDAFATATRLGRHEVLAYANADMLFVPELLDAAHEAAHRRALVVGRRVDLDLDGELDLAPGWPDRLRAEAEARGRRGEENQLDYMLFPRDVAWEMPPFAVGRPGWDNWLLYRARSLGLPLVDASPLVLAVHQSHGYEHVPGRTGPRWQGPEGERNRALAATMGIPYGLLDAEHVLTPHGLRRALGARHLVRRARRTRAVGPALRAVDALRRRV